jgi:hypothetical protein
MHSVTRITCGPVPESTRLPICIATVVLSAVLLFLRLGHYALWDDESYTALAGIGVWKTGDTSARIDHNIVAFRGGVALRNFRDRFHPPLPAYLAAPFVGAGGRSALAARSPFAACGLILVCLAMCWVWRMRLTAMQLLIVCLAILGNVAMFLYFRQCRYYALTMLGMALLCWSYLCTRVRGRTWLMLFSSLVLLSSNYISFAAAACAVAVDYLIWGRRSRKITLSQWGMILLPLLVIGGAVVWLWNPLGLDPIHERATQSLRDRALLVWWYARDFCRAEFAPTALLLAAPLVYAWMHDPLLVRGAVAVALFVVVTAILSPQDVRITANADVRYAAAVIPVAIALQVIVLLALAKLSHALALVLALAAFATNGLTLAPLLGEPFRSTTFLYARELVRPPTDPYRATSDWIKSNVAPGRSVWVVPDWMTYPLMYHAPHAVYAWQLSPPPSETFAELSPVHFRGMVQPDYVIAFGPAGMQQLEGASGAALDRASYDQSEVLNVFWLDVHRPELFWHGFEPIEGFDPMRYGVRVFRRRPTG